MDYWWLIASFQQNRHPNFLLQLITHLSPQGKGTMRGVHLPLLEILVDFYSSKKVQIEPCNLLHVTILL